MAQNPRSARLVDEAVTGAAASPLRPAPRRRLTVARRRQAAGAVFAAPAVLMVTVFFFVPLALTFYMSLHNWSLLGAHTWIGFENYTRAFSDANFRDAFVFTLEYTAVTTPVLFFIGLGLALLVRRRRFGVALLPVGLLPAGRHRLRLGELPVPLHGPAGARAAVRPHAARSGSSTTRRTGSRARGRRCCSSWSA